jgi:cyclopropane-fatty-acyl-phospholipid synthase
MSMGLFKLEHSRFAYRADFALYGAAVLALAAVLMVGGPPAQRFELFAWVLAGLAIWPPIEYALHRYVLHGPQPFRGWHAQHHERPMARIGSPTLFSASLFVVFFFLPAWGLGGLWPACALTLGVVSGYLAYGVTHHATHHWRADGGWLKQRKRWHALHHHAQAPNPGCYGVTSAFWDRACGSTRRAATAERGR